MSKIFEFLGQNASVTIIFGLILGLILQPLAAAAKPILLPAVWAILTLSMYRLDYNSFINFLQKRSQLTILILWLLFMCPIIMYYLASNLPINNNILIAMVMTAGSSPLIGAAAIGRLLKLNNAMILALLVSATILAPVTLPFIALKFLNLELGLSAVNLVLRLGLLIGTASLAAFILRFLTRNHNQNISERSLDGLTVILFWACGVPLMDGVTEKFVLDPEGTILLILITFGVYIGLMILGTVFAYIIWRNMENAISVGLTSGCRNLAVIIVVLPQHVDREIILYFALAQFPIYLMPIVLKFFGSRFFKS